MREANDKNAKKNERDISLEFENKRNTMNLKEKS